MKRSLAAVLTAAVLASSAGAAMAESASDQMTGRHSMTGEVTKVDAKKGWLHVKTSEGTMIVYVPASELASVKKGDNITLDLALKDNGPAPKDSGTKR